MGNRLIRTLNSAAGLSSSDSYVGAAQREENVDFVGRVRVVNADPRTKAAWSEILSNCRLLRVARRSSFSEDDRCPLWSRVEKHVEEIYAKELPDMSPYLPFVATRVKELPANSPSVDLLERLPGPIAEAIKDPTRMIRPLSPAEKVEGRALNRRYSHCGGAQAEFEAYLNSPAAGDLWTMEREEDIQASVAVLAVGRRKDDGLRKILAAVPKNWFWFRPEQVLPRRRC